MGEATSERGVVPDTTTRVRLLYPDSGEYSVASSLVSSVYLDQWQEVEFHLPSDLLRGRLRVDPSELPGVIEIRELVIRTPGRGEPLWSIRQCREVDLESSGTSVAIPLDGGFTVVSYGTDPQILLPELCGVSRGAVVRVEMRVCGGLMAIGKFINSLAARLPALAPNTLSELAELRTRCTEYEERRRLDHLQIELLQGDLDAVSAERGEFADSGTRIQLFYPDSGGYTETSSLLRTVHINEWQEVEFGLPAAVTHGRLRLDPSDRPCVVEIRELVIGTPYVSEPLWSLGHGNLELDGTAVSIPRETYTVLSYGSDPQIVLPELPGLRAGAVVRLQIRVGVGTTALTELIHSVAAGFSPPVTATSREDDQSQLDRLQIDLLRGDLDAVVNENEAQSALALLRSERDQAIRNRAEILHSWSWRLTSFLRRAGAIVQRARSWQSP